jgi:Protein of unknown function (DUF2786)
VRRETILDAGVGMWYTSGVADTGVNEMTTNQSVIEKIRKLLAMADGNANEHEAAIAAAKAQELLEAYNLDMAAIGKDGGAFAPRQDKNKAGGLYSWQRHLWNAVANLNFCNYWYIRGLTAGSQYEHRVLGSHVNVISTEVMADYLQQTIERLARNWVTENRPGKSIFIKEAIAYREGIAHRISERLWAQRREHLAEQAAKQKAERERNAAQGINTENALVLQDVVNTEEDLNNDYINRWEPGTSARYRKDREVRQAAAERAAMEILRKQDEWDEAHPEEAAKRKARERKMQERLYEEWVRNAKKTRYRKPTPEQERMMLGSYSEGYREGDKVSLNRQVSKNTNKRIPK